MLEKYREQIDAFGYEIEPFGGKEYAVTAIPADFTGIDTKTMFLEMLDDFANINENDSPNAIMEKLRRCPVRQLSRETSTSAGRRQNG